MANRGKEIDIRNFESNLISTPWAKKMMIIFHSFHIAVYLTLFVIGSQYSFIKLYLASVFFFFG